MPQLEYFIICESVSVDQGTNRISLFNVLEEVASPDFPSVIPQIVAVSAWNREPYNGDTDYQVILQIHSPGEEKPKEFSTNFKMPRKKHRIFQNVMGIPISKTGELKFEIYLNGKYIASHVISIDKLAEDVSG